MTLWPSTRLRNIAGVAKQWLHQMLPEALKPDYPAIFFAQEQDRDHWELAKAVDKICTYIKCLEEPKAGNQEFAKAEKALKGTITGLDLPEVAYFIAHSIKGQ